jgi:hypothetical protein
MRIASLIMQLVGEVRAPLDEAVRTRLAEIHRRSISELEQGLAPELIEELERITLPFGDEAPSDAELSVAQAQLVGWLEGLFHGIQTTLFASRWPPYSSCRPCAVPRTSAGPARSGRRFRPAPRP